MKLLKTTLLLFICCVLNSNAQKMISATLIDSTKQSPIPFATIALNNKTGVITNEKGNFSITIHKEITPQDSLFISCLGYDQKRIAVLNFTDSIIPLNVKAIELNEVMLSNKNYTVDEIIEKIKGNLDTNYDYNYIKRKLFFRESHYSNILKSDIILKKSTIPEFNQEFIDSILVSVPKKTDSYTEVLGEMYGKVMPDNKQKLDILKATRLYDKKNEVTFENYEKRFNEIIKKHVKRNSYFKIKSGWFGTKEEIDSSFFVDKKEEVQTAEMLEKQKELEQARKKSFLSYRKNTIYNLEKDNFLFEDTDLNFLDKSRKYNFELLDYVFLNNDFVYAISFSPKRSADFKGTMYVNTDDFAIVRVDYENVKPLRTFKLLGISLNEFLKKGTLIFSKNTNDKYALKYAEVEYGNKVGIKRPLKIIEKNKHVKGRRKQNEIAGKVNFIVSNITKKELVVFESDAITEPIFAQFKEEANIKPTYLPQYDPEFWKGHNIIEPNQAIKDFKIIE